MRSKKIEKRPPDMTGDPRTDTQRLAEYMEYLREEINFILTLLYKQLNE